VKERGHLEELVVDWEINIKIHIEICVSMPWRASLYYAASGTFVNYLCTVFHNKLGS
jgi:hypothetical protein